MYLSRTKLLTLALSLGLAGAATAAPPPGSRWSDQAFGRPSRSSARVAPAAIAPTVVSGTAVTTATPAVAGQTVAVRGPDGVVRYFPVAGGAVVRQQTGSPNLASQTVMIRGADGVVRQYQVAPSPAAPGTGTVVQPAPVVVGPCRCP
jgi:hypothetical protein